jgi:hypothetical protein
MYRSRLSPVLRLITLHRPPPSQVFPCTLGVIRHPPRRTLSRTRTSLASQKISTSSEHHIQILSSRYDKVAPTGASQHHATRRTRSATTSSPLLPPHLHTQEACSPATPSSSPVAAVSSKAQHRRCTPPSPTSALSPIRRSSTTGMNTRKATWHSRNPSNQRARPSLTWKSWWPKAKQQGRARLRTKRGGICS